MVTLHLRSVFLQLAVKSCFSDAQKFGGLQAIAVGVANGGEDRVLFKVGEWGKAVASGLERSTGLHEQRAGKMLRPDLILCVHRASPLDRILKLADIARPLIFQQAT